jgi:hypothetical protein
MTDWTAEIERNRQAARRDAGYVTVRTPPVAVMDVPPPVKAPYPLFIRNDDLRDWIRRLVRECGPLTANAIADLICASTDRWAHNTICAQVGRSDLTKFDRIQRGNRWVTRWVIG